MYQTPPTHTSHRVIDGSGARNYCACGLVFYAPFPSRSEVVGTRRYPNAAEREAALVTSDAAYADHLASVTS